MTAAEQVRAALIRILETDECSSFLCSERISTGSGLCVGHMTEARKATDLLMHEIHIFLGDYDEQEQQNQ